MRANETCANPPSGGVDHHHQSSKKTPKIKSQLTKKHIFLGKEHARFGFQTHKKRERRSNARTKTETTSAARRRGESKKEHLALKFFREFILRAAYLWSLTRSSALPSGEDFASHRERRFPTPRLCSWRTVWDLFERCWCCYYLRSQTSSLLFRRRRCETMMEESVSSSGGGNAFGKKDLA